MEQRKPIGEQVIVVTGASSGIGLVTARAAAEAGARVALVSRDGATLSRLAHEFDPSGSRVIAVPADVSIAADIERAVAATVTAFGRIDTWINNAGVASYATLAELPLAEHRRIFETNYWGVVNGSLAAVRHFRTRSGAGTLINIGSVNSDVAVPLLSAYSASKHAVKGFTDALRRELLRSDPAIRVVLVKPAGIATPFPQHARNHMRHEPRVVPPLYEPLIVADTILHLARHPLPSVTVGAVGPVLRSAQRWFPGLTDRVLARIVPPLSTSAHDRTGSDNLDSPSGDGRSHYRYAPGLPVSPYTVLQRHPRLANAGTVLVVLSALALIRFAGRSPRPPRR